MSLRKILNKGKNAFICAGLSAYLLGSSGCSLMFTRNAPERNKWDEIEYTNCTDHYGWVAMDVLGTLSSVSSTIASSVLLDNLREEIAREKEVSAYYGNKSPKEKFLAVSSGINLVFIFVYAGSAIKGAFEVSECNLLKERIYQRKNELERKLKEEMYKKLLDKKSENNLENGVNEGFSNRFREPLSSNIPFRYSLLDREGSSDIKYSLINKK